jgi:Protein of unknown function (DUF998)
MSTLKRPSLQAAPSKPSTVRKVLLLCGIAASLLYAVANDLLAAMLYKGYSPFSQTVSELTSIGAPTRAPLLAVGVIFMGLLMAFAIGVWQSRDLGKPALRITAVLLIGYAAMQPLWLPFPMSARGQIQTTSTVTDIMHISLGLATVLFQFTAIGFGAAAFGRRFRVYSIVTLATELVFGALVFVYVPRVSAGEPTPWLGVVERINIAAWMLWLAVLAVTLLRRQSALAQSNTGGSWASVG